MPSNTCTRSVLPSTILKCTRTVSPMRNSPGSAFSCSASIAFITSMSDSFRFLRRSAARAPAPPAGGRPRPRARGGSPSSSRRSLQPPPADVLVVPRQQHLGHPHAPEHLGPRVVRVLQQPRREALLREGVLGDDPLHEPRHRVDRPPSRRPRPRTARSLPPTPRRSRRRRSPAGRRPRSGRTPAPGPVPAASSAASRWS